MATTYDLTSDDDMDAVLQAAGEAVYWWEQLKSATNMLEKAHAVTELENHMSDLSSWLPGYDPETGEVDWDKQESLST